MNAMIRNFVSTLLLLVPALSYAGNSAPNVASKSGSIDQASLKEFSFADELTVRVPVTNFKVKIERLPEARAIEGFTSDGYVGQTPALKDLLLVSNKGYKIIIPTDYDADNVAKLKEMASKIEIIFKMDSKKMPMFKARNIRAWSVVDDDDGGPRNSLLDSEVKGNELHAKFYTTTLFPAYNETLKDRKIQFTADVFVSIDKTEK